MPTLMDIAPTDPAIAPPVWGDIGVGIYKLMAALAMSFTCIHSRWRDGASQRVISRRYGFQMVGIDTVPDSTEMIKRQALGDRPYAELVRPAMRIDVAAVNTHNPVALRHTGCPSPASICKGYLEPKSLNYSALCSSIFKRAMIHPAVIMGITPAACVRAAFAAIDGTGRLVLHRVTSGVAGPDVQPSRLHFIVAGAV